MIHNKSGIHRRNLITWGLGMLGSVAAAGIWLFKGQKEKKTVKMLSENGMLVEVDEQLVAAMKSGKRITNEELKGWVKK